MSIANYVGFAVSNAFSNNAVYNTSEALYFLELDKYPKPIGITTISGGNIINGATKVVDSVGYKYHTFTSDGKLTVGTNTTVDILLVGAGGNGAYSGLDPQPGSNNPISSGGGGGGVLVLQSVTIGRGVYDVTVGQKETDNSTQRGGDTILSFQGQEIVKAIGGGHGGSSAPNVNSYPGGSGGGLNPGNPQGTGIQPTQSFPDFPAYESAITLSIGSDGHPAGGGGGSNLSIISPIPAPNIPFAAVGVAGTVPTDDFNDFYGDTIGLPAINSANGRFGAGGGAGLFFPGVIPSPQVPISSSSNGGIGGGGNGSRVFSGPGGSNPSGRPNPPIPYNFAASSAVEATGSGGGGGTGQSGTIGSQGANGVFVLRYTV